MQSRFLTLALAATLTATAASVSLYAAMYSRDRGTTAKLIEPVAAPTSGSRIYLAAAQISETRNSALWPAEIRSLLRVEDALEYGEWLWNDSGVPNGAPTIRVDLGTQLISVSRGGHEIGTAVILYGAESHATPLGRFPILSRAANYHSRTYDAPMPYALRLTSDGVAIHGSDVHAGSATHGCIGVPLEFARKLFDQVRKGDEVLIVRS